MFNQLIIQRLVINQEGKIEGDNRVTELFETEFDKYMQSDDILWGREYKLTQFGWGNSGYRVYIYDNGLICLFLVIVFYFMCIFTSRNRRAKTVMAIITAAAFIPRATPLSYYFLVPLYLLAFVGYLEGMEKDAAVEEPPIGSEHSLSCSTDGLITFDDTK